MFDYVQQFLHALLFSIFVESLVVLILCGIFKKEKWISSLAILGTLCTIPYMWFVFPTVFWYSSNMIVYLGEGSVFLFEAVLYKVLGKLRWRDAIVFSLLANLASYFLGKI